MNQRQINHRVWEQVKGLIGAGTRHGYGGAVGEPVWRGVGVPVWERVRGRVRFQIERRAAREGI